MRIGLLGMSAVGKTFWANQLASLGFVCFHCDDLIASKLGRELHQPFDDLYDVGRWMGFPFEKGFHEKESLYLALERATQMDLADMLRSQQEDASSVVVDMTGSAIYAPEEVLLQLKQSLVMVYLALTPEVHQTMLQAYLQQPRPLIWRGLFTQAPGESLTAALRHSYARLISYREKLYEKFCDVKLEYRIHRQEGLTVEEFVRAIRTALPA